MSTIVQEVSRGLIDKPAESALNFPVLVETLEVGLERTVSRDTPEGFSSFDLANFVAIERSFVGLAKLRYGSLSLSSQELGSNRSLLFHRSPVVIKATS